MSNTAPALPFFLADLGFEPVDGWILCEVYGFERYEPPYRVAWKSGFWLTLGASPRFFTPTQERFAWIVRNNFPIGRRDSDGFLCTLDDAYIDAAIAAEAVQGLAA